MLWFHTAIINEFERIFNYENLLEKKILLCDKID